MKKLLIPALLTAPSFVTADFPKLQLEPVAIAQFFAPTTVTHAGDGSGRLFISDQRGEILILGDSGVIPTPFLDLEGKLVPERSGFDERGLLGLAFHPDYSKAETPGEGRFYVYYSAPSADQPGSAEDPVDHQSIVAEYRLMPGSDELADPASERILLRFNQPQFNHDGGQLAFGPDGMLYIATGDGGSANDNNAGHTGGSSSRPSGALGNAQDLTKLLGKVLRIDPLGDDGAGGEYGIPTSNPFATADDGTRKEIYAYGLRNPWRFSFDDGPGGSNRLFLADVGQGRFEEINLITSGGNYGWRRFEGFADFDLTTPSSGPYVAPIAAYAHPGSAGSSGLTEVGLSITGGFVYRGSAIPELIGKYVFGDWSDDFGVPNGTLLGLEEETPDNFSLSVLEVEGGNPIGRYITTFGEDEDGELYVATRTALAPSASEPGTSKPSGQLFRIIAAPDSGTTTLIATKDNSIFDESEGNSNGAGSLFAGLTTGNASGSRDVRRALVQFDLSSLPASARVTDASLTLRVTKSRTGASDFTLHKLLKTWGEGSSSRDGVGAPASAGEATWSHSEFGSTSWAASGGDFEPNASATSSVAFNGSYTWTSADLATDVQSWLESPAENHGWLLKGPEATPSAKRFDSRDASTSTNRPSLSVSYLTGTHPSQREAWEQQYFEVGEFIDPEADPDFDTIGNLLEYAWDLDPGTRDQLTEHLLISIGPDNNTLSGFFRRDPRASDLTYVFEMSEDLERWTPLVTSTLGDPPTGPAFDFETSDPAKPETLRVELDHRFDPASSVYLRLRVIRP